MIIIIAKIIILCLIIYYEIYYNLIYFIVFRRQKYLIYDQYLVDQILYHILPNLKILFKLKVFKKNTDSLLILFFDGLLNNLRLGLVKHLKGNRYLKVNLLLIFLIILLKAIHEPNILQQMVLNSDLFLIKVLQNQLLWGWLQISHFQNLVINLWYSKLI